MGSRYVTGLLATGVLISGLMACSEDSGASGAAGAQAAGGSAGAAGSAVGGSAGTAGAAGGAAGTAGAAGGNGCGPVSGNCLNTTDPKKAACHEFSGLSSTELTETESKCQSSIKGDWIAGAACDPGSSSFCAQCVMPQVGAKCYVIKYDDASYGCSSEGKDETKNNCVANGGTWEQ